MESSMAPTKVPYIGSMSLGVTRNLDLKPRYPLQVGVLIVTEFFYRTFYRTLL